MKFPEERELRRCASCRRDSLRCCGLDVHRHSGELLAVRYRCSECSHSIELHSGSWMAWLSLLGALVLIGVPLRVFVHEMIQLSGGIDGHGWYEWLFNGGLLFAGLLLGGGLLFAERKHFRSLAASFSNPVVGVAP